VNPFSSGLGLKRELPHPLGYAEAANHEAKLKILQCHKILGL